MSIYQALYDLVNTYVFGGLIATGSYQELVAIFFATAGCVFMVSLPFLVVWKIIKTIMG